MRGLDESQRAGTASGQSGLTLPEVLVALVIVGVLSAIAVTSLSNMLDKVRLARCLADLTSIRDTVFQAAIPTLFFPSPDEFWNGQWSGVKSGPYHYLVDAEDPDAGHGNDLDAFDEQNPGNAPREQIDIKFVLVCEHDHGDLARYVYVVDQGAPTIATASDNPGWDTYVKRGTGKKPGRRR